MINQNPPFAQELLSHQTFLRRLAIDLVGEDADDLVQEVWRRALERPPHPGHQLRGWLARVASNLATDRWRGEARRRSREERLASEQPSVDELEARFELRRELVGALASLSQPCRETILLRYFEGLAPRDIARRQGTPVATVKTRLRRGLEQLRLSLDKRYGGDRATWMSAVTALAAPVGSGVVTGTLLIEVIAMGTMIKVSAAVLVVAACAYFVTRTPGTESARMAGLEPPAADVELEGAALLSADEDLAAEAGQRSPVAQDSVGVSAVLRTNVLRVILEGITEEDARMTRVTLTGVDTRDKWPTEIRDSWLCQGLTSELDLNPFFASVAEREGNLRVDELEVYVDHPLYLVETARVALSRGVELKSGRTVFEVRVQLVPAGVIYGRLAREDGGPAGEGMVGALLLEDGFPIEDVGRAADCAADGAFEIRVSASGLYALASYGADLRPTTTPVEVLLGTRVDVGTIALESGHSITGFVLRQGNPVTGVSVSASPPRNQTSATPEAINSGLNATVNDGRTFISPARSLHLVWLTPTTTFTNPSANGSRRGGRFELGGGMVSVDENGAFVFGGLGPIEYLLRIGELAEAHGSLGDWGDAKWEGMIYINGGKPGLPVRAPEHGVVLDFRETVIRFELAGDLESDAEGRLTLRARVRGGGTPVDENGVDLRLVADPLAKNLNFMPEFHSAQFSLFGDEPTYVFQAPANKHMTGEVTFPGRQPVPLDFSTPEPGGELVIPIQLLRGEEEEATLVIELETPPAEIPETFTVLLWRAGQDGFPPDTRLVGVAEGQLRVEGLSPGKYRVRVRAGVDRSYPTGLFFENELDLELHPGLVVTRSIMLREGAGLRLTVRDEDGELVGGEFTFVDHLGGRVNLTLEVGEGQRRGYSYLRFYPYGTHESVNPLHPGSYRLVLLSPGYAKRSVMVELRTGEYEDVDVTLSK